MKNFVKWYAVAFFLVCSLSMFAQSSENDAGNTGSNGTPVDDADPSGSIDNQLIYLGIAGAVFAYAFYRNGIEKKAA